MIRRNVLLRENNIFISNKPSKGIGVVSSGNKENVTNMEVKLIQK